MSGLTDEDSASCREGVVTLDADAFQAQLYQELKRLARARLRRSGRPQFLDTTELVHESWFKLSAQMKLAAHDRAHFMAYAACAIRSIIVDHARARQALVRGGNATHVPLDEMPSLPHRDDEYLQVHEALLALSQTDERLAKLVELRYFVGLEETECAEVLGVARRTIQRDWQKAKALLWSLLAA